LPTIDFHLQSFKNKKINIESSVFILDWKDCISFIPRPVLTYNTIPMLQSSRRPEVDAFAPCGIFCMQVTTMNALSSDAILEMLANDAAPPTPYTRRELAMELAQRNRELAQRNRELAQEASAAVLAAARCLYDGGKYVHAAYCMHLASKIINHSEHVYDTLSLPLQVVHSDSDQEGSHCHVPGQQLAHEDACRLLRCRGRCSGGADGVGGSETTACHRGCSLRNNVIGLYLQIGLHQCGLLYA
jgi:hypothetical protein